MVRTVEKPEIKRHQSGSTPSPFFIWLRHRTKYYYYHRQVVEVQKAEGTGDPDQDNAYAQYLWHPYYIDAPIKRWLDTDTDGTLEGDEDEGAEIDGEHFYTHDANFNVTALLETDGDVLERYHYDAYGKVTRMDGDWDDDPEDDYLNPYLYTGRRLDEETGLQYSRARYYHTTLGRFINRDYVQFLNRYEYAFGAPVNWVDYNGLAPADPAEPAAVPAKPDIWWSFPDGTSFPVDYESGDTWGTLCDRSNCVGYACGAGGALVPLDSKGSLHDFLEKKYGLKCDLWTGKTADECVKHCGDCQFATIVYA